MRIPWKVGTDSTASWAAMPRLGHSDRLVQGVRLDLLIKRFHRGGSLSHAFAGKGQSVDVTDEPVENGVSRGWITVGVVPMLDRRLAGDDR